MPMPRKSGPRRTRADPPPVRPHRLAAPGGVRKASPRYGEVDELTIPPDLIDDGRRAPAQELRSTRGREHEIELAGCVPRGPAACACLPSTRPAERDNKDVPGRPAATGRA